MNKLMKILTICLAAVMLLALTACGGNETSQTGKDSGKTADIGGTVLLDSEDVKVTVSKMDYYEEESQPMLRLSIENNTDKTLWMRAKQVSVNGFMDNDPYCVTYHDEARDLTGTWEVLAQSSGDNYGLLFSMLELERAGVTQVGDVELTVCGSWEEYAEDYMGEPVTIHVADVNQTINEEGTVVVDNDQVKIVVQGTNQDEYLGPEAIIYAYNKSDKAFSLSMATAVVDGKETFGYFGAELAPGKRSVSACAFEDMAEATEIKELTCSFTAYSSDEWEELFTTEEVTVSF